MKVQTSGLNRLLDRLEAWLVMRLLMLIADVVDAAPPRPTLPPLRPETIARAMELRRRDELIERLWVLDSYLWLALRGRAEKATPKGLPS